jgi:hypothetical protein
MDISQLRLLARLFTRPAFSELASKSAPTKWLNYLVDHRVVQPSVSSVTLAEFLDEAFKKIARSYRNEYVFKTALANKIVFGRHSPRTAGMQIELPVGRSIVDAAIFNGTSTAYEIKTEFDTSRRLATQTQDYLKAFDKVFVVTTKECALRYDEITDSRVGILTLSGTGSFSLYRDASSNKTNVEPSVIFRCLRRKEFIEVLLEEGGEVDFPNGLLHEKCEEQFKRLSSLRCHEAFLQAMRNRTTEDRVANFVKTLPFSLRSLGLATPLSEPQRVRLVDALRMPVNLRLIKN